MTTLRWYTFTNEHWRGTQYVPEKCDTSLYKPVLGQVALQVYNSNIWNVKTKQDTSTETILGLVFHWKKYLHISPRPLEAFHWISLAARSTFKRIVSTSPALRPTIS